MIEDLGGKLLLKNSYPGQRSTFLATFKDSSEKSAEIVRPEGVAPSERSGSMETLALSGVKVLSVDDAIDNQLLVKKILQRHGAEVETAANGAEGYEKAITGKFDIVLMDIQMPVLDGYRATEKLRENGFTRPIIAITAFASPQDREKCLQAGCDDYMPKPINSAELVQMILDRSTGA